MLKFSVYPKPTGAETFTALHAIIKRLKRWMPKRYTMLHYDGYRDGELHYRMWRSKKK